MAGLYIHIPFCKSRCIYCGFYSTTLHGEKEAYVDALEREMRLRGNGMHVGTIYLGGGTPSQLPADLLRRLFIYINKVYEVDKDAEITMECNPDDVDEAYADTIGALPINRVSLGAQTFSDKRLRFLCRRHTARQVEQAVRRLRASGIANISVDLMFGFPGQTTEEWEADLQAAIDLDVEHLSAYSLMLEEGTPLQRLAAEGRLPGEKDEETEREMYEMLIDKLGDAGFEHYEISNFARRTDASDSALPSPFRSRHNSSYWNGTPYVGLGAAAHSYDGSTRSWNVADIGAYIRHLKDNKLPVEEREILDDATRYNDLVTTALRTREGISLTVLRNEFPPRFADYLLQNAKKAMGHQLLTLADERLRLTRNGLFVSDDVMSDLIYID